MSRTTALLVLIVLGLLLPARSGHHRHEDFALVEEEEPRIVEIGEPRLHS